MVINPFFRKKYVTIHHAKMVKTLTISWLRFKIKSLTFYAPTLAEETSNNGKHGKAGDHVVRNAVEHSENEPALAPKKTPVPEATHSGSLVPPSGDATITIE